MIHDLSKSNSVFNQFVAEIRDENIQTDRMRFRRNLERIGEVLGYELSKTFEYQEEVVQSPLGEAIVSKIKDEVVLATVLRAGLPLHQGLLNYFDSAENAFISAYRKYINDEEFDIRVEYLACPSIEGKVVIIADPMLATGSSVELVYKSILKKGKPKSVYVVSAVASKSGVNHLKRIMPKGTQFWLGAIDSELTAKAYIVPGLGDAGDLAYGKK